jgi:hypothetical protein
MCRTYLLYVNLMWFDRALSLICGNKMPTRCNRWFLLHILLLAQHVSGTTMPIIRSSRVLYRWLLPVVFGALVFKLSVWCGAEGYVSGLRAAAPNTTGSNHLYNTLEILMMDIVVPETCWSNNKICNKNHVASSWHFISTILCTSSSNLGRAFNLSRKLIHMIFEHTFLSPYMFQ